MLPGEETLDHSVADKSIQNRLLSEVIVSRGKPIAEFADSLELLRAMRDAVKGHRSLLEKGRILHRDISINNIMITINREARPDRFYGFLIDLDLAIDVEATEPSGVIDRTGTWEFMSIEAIDGKPDFIHTYYHDLQSFLYVFIWIVAGEKLRKELVEKWDSKHAGAYKLSQMITWEEFASLLRGIENSVNRKVVEVLRGVLWPDWGRLRKPEELMRDDKRVEFYEGMISGFQMGVDMLEGVEEPVKGVEEPVKGIKEPVKGKRNALSL